MVDTVQPKRLLRFKPSRVVAAQKNSLIWNNTTHGTTPGKRLPWSEGWMSRKISAPPVPGEKCSLTSPFIEQAFAHDHILDVTRAEYYHPTHEGFDMPDGEDDLVTIGIAAMCEEGDTFVLGVDVRATYGRSPIPPSDECGKMFDVPPFDLISCIAGSVPQTEAIFSEFCNQMQIHATTKTHIKFENVRNAFEFARKKELRRLQECKFIEELHISLRDWLAGKVPDGRPLDKLAFDYGRILLQQVKENFNNGLIVAGFANGERIFLKGYKTRPVEEASSPHIHVIGYQPAAIEAMKLLTRRGQNIDMTLQRTLYHIHEAMLTAKKFGDKMVGMPAAYAIIRDRRAKRPNGMSRFHAASPVLKDWLRAYKRRDDTSSLDTLTAEIMVRNQLSVHTPRRTNRNLTDTAD